GLERREPCGERREDGGLAAAVLGEQQREVVLERQLEALEAPELIEGELLEAKSHDALLGGPSGETSGLPPAAAAASASYRSSTTRLVRYSPCCRTSARSSTSKVPRMYSAS